MGWLLMQASDIKFYLTGANSDGDTQTQPNKSLGGFRGSEIDSGNMRNIFDHVSSSEAESGDVEYRCVCIKNIHSVDSLTSAKVWLDSNTSSEESNIEIAIDAPSSQPSGSTQTIDDESTAPLSLTFYDSCIDSSTGLELDDLEPGYIYYVWIKRTINAGAPAALDSFTLKVNGVYEYKTSATITGAQCREARRNTPYNPNFSFTKPTASKLKAHSGSTSMGYGYWIFYFDKDVVRDNTLRVTWNGEYSHTLGIASGKTFARIDVLDGTQDPSKDSFWNSRSSIEDARIGTVCTKSTDDSSNPYTFTETDEDYTITISGGSSDNCMLLFTLNDAWAEAGMNIEIDKVQIIDSDTEEVLYTEDFDDQTLTMDRTDTHADYGHLYMTVAQQASRTINQTKQSNYAIVDINNPTTRSVFDNGLIRLRSRLETDMVDAGSLDIWIKEAVWDGSATSQSWEYYGRLMPEADVFDSQCPWSRVFINYMDFNKTVMRYYFTSSIYMDVTLYRASQGLKVEWSSGATGYMYWSIANDKRPRFGYGEGADLVDANAETEDGWNNLGTTNNWCIVWDDTCDYFLGLELTDDSTTSRCYSDISNDVITKLSTGTSSDLNEPHFWFYSRKFMDTVYRYYDATLSEGAKIVIDNSSSDGYSLTTPDYSASSDEINWAVWNVCSPNDYKLVERRKSSKTGTFGFNESDGTNGVGINNETFGLDGYYWDYLIYVPKKCRINTDISGPEDVANELLMNWDYGIFIVNDDDRDYEITPTYSDVTNDWSVDPDEYFVIPPSIDDIETGNPTFYRFTDADFANAERLEDTDATPDYTSHWSTETRKSLTADDSAYMATSGTPGMLSWSMNIPNNKFWAYARLRAETDGTIGYRIMSTNVGGSYDLTEDCHRDPDPVMGSPINQGWSTFEGAFRVLEGTSNTIKLRGYGTSDRSQLYVVDRVDVVPVEIAPFKYYVPRGSAITISNIESKRINENRWRNMFLSEEIRGRARLNYMDVNDGMDMNQHQMLEITVENLSSAPASPSNGQIYFNTSDNKFYGYKGNSWVEL
jgi:hypothetical protein